MYGRNTIGSARGMSGREVTLPRGPVHSRSAPRRPPGVLNAGSVRAIEQRDAARQPREVGLQRHRHTAPHEQRLEHADLRVGPPQGVGALNVSVTSGGGLKRRPGVAGVTSRPLTGKNP